ncbi:MAG: tetratricopeptide repeat protein [Deltaproteobacteria bacterium]|nr:tetratricopeptide repeat protein [Deltaproteobacteria bacterium]
MFSGTIHRGKGRSLRAVAAAAILVALLGGYGLIKAREERSDAGQAGSQPAAAADGGLRLWAEPLSIEVGETATVRCELSPATPGPARFAFRARKGGQVEGPDAENKGECVASFVAVGAEGYAEIAVSALVEGEAEARSSSIFIDVRPRSPRTWTERPPITVISKEMRARSPEGKRLDAEIERLRAIDHKRGTHFDVLKANKAREELAWTYLEAGRFDEAYETFTQLLFYTMRGSEPFRQHSAGLGEAAFHLGRIDEALERFREAQDWLSPYTAYIAGEILEHKGLFDEAIEKYTYAKALNQFSPWAIFRLALLKTKRGDDPKEIVDMFVRASPRFGRKLIMSRLEHDREMAPVLALIQKSGRVGDLKDVAEKLSGPGYLWDPPADPPLVDEQEGYVREEKP